MQNKQKGFTLIELLVVIAIIGILATIVLTSLSGARAKANDAKVQGQLSGLRAAAESYYSDQNPNSYGTATTACDNMFADASMANLLSLPTGSTKHCDSTGAAWAVWATLPSDVTTGFCVDSAGSAKKSTTTLPSGNISDCSAF